MLELSENGTDMKPLFETIIKHIPAPTGDPDADTQILISTIDYNEYVGRIGIGKVENGSIRVNQDALLVNHHDPSVNKKVKISKLYEFDGLNKVEVNDATVGSIVAISGIADIHIGCLLYTSSRPFQQEKLLMGGCNSGCPQKMLRIPLQALQHLLLT